MSTTLSPQTAAPSPAAAEEMTAAEFLSLPDDGRDRMLIRGHLWDKKMTYRNVFHSSVMAQLTYLLTHWLISHGSKPWKVITGEAGVRLRAEPLTIVGVDLAIVPRDAKLLTDKTRTIIDEPPLLAVEILSPSDRQREVQAKVDEYLATGVKCVWVVDPHFRTVVAHRPQQHPQMFAGDADLIEENLLPGFREPVARVFETL